MGYYDRYEKFRVDGEVKNIPFIRIPYSETDLTIIYNRDTIRFDTLSYKYYGDPNYGWLILMANPTLGGYEYLIDNGSKLRIPYPLDNAISRYEVEVNNIVKNN